MKRRLRGYEIAVACVLAAMIVRALTLPLFPNRITLPFFLFAVIATIRWGGYRAAWLAVLLGAIPAMYFRLHVNGEFVFDAGAAVTLLVNHFISGTIFILLGRSDDNSRQAAEHRVTEAQLHERLLEDEIAGRKAVEQVLRDRQQELELALEAGRMGTWVWDMTTDWVQTSTSNAVIHGRAPDRTHLTIQESMAEIHPDDRPAVANSIEAAARGKRVERVTYRVCWPDGSVRWVEAVGRAFVDDAGTAVRALGVCADITDRKLAEIALEASEARLQGILDNTTAVVYLKDPLGRYITVNRQFEQLFHISRQAIVGKRDRELFPADFVKRFEENDARVRETGEPLTFVEVVPHDDGLHTYLSVKFAIKNEEGAVWAVGGVSTDITELKQATDDLRNERELLKGMIEVQENEKQSICSDIHDGLIQYAAGALMQIEAFRRSHLTGDGLDRIDEAITSLRRAVNEGRRVIRGVRPSVLDDSGVLAGIEDLIDELSHSRLRAEFIHDEEIGRLPPEMETAIYRVVQEALNNAKKHSGADRVRIELHRTNGDVHVEVRDWGRGFDPQAPRQRTFGLIGMAERIRLLGGQCSIESRQNAGTRVIVHLPVHDGEMAAR